MNNKEVITFSLKTTSIDPSIIYTDYFNKTVTTPNGIVSNNRCSFTWYDINLRNIVGNNMYEKYDKFNISLNTIAMSSQATNTSMTVDPRILYIKCSGLPWISSYNSSNASTYATLNVIQIPITPSVTYLNNINNPQILTFSKNTENVNINIVLHSIELDNFDIYLSDQLFGHFSFLFSISGVIEDEINIERNRINIK